VRRGWVATTRAVGISKAGMLGKLTPSNPEKNQTTAPVAEVGLEENPTADFGVRVKLAFGFRAHLLL
jgi:hypothetical protein